jgi:methylenetetrahydrofolate reductase (NADPH)
MHTRSRAATVRRLLAGARYEVLPTPGVEEAVANHLPVDRTVTVTASPARGLEATIALSERLAARGYDVVPHLAARMIPGRSGLAEVAQRLKQAGVTTIFVPAGDADPVGPYVGALDLLDDLAAIGNPFTHVGITGYPETHPTIRDDVTVQTMWDKRRHATHIVSNLTFDPKVLGGWVRRVRARGVTTPIMVGLPGPVDRTKLLKVATKVGVGESTKFLAKNRGVFARIAVPGGYDPMRLLTRAADVLGSDDMKVVGLHLFTFNQVAETEAWRVQQLARLDAGVAELKRSER